MRWGNWRVGARSAGRGRRGPARRASRGRRRAIASAGCRSRRAGRACRDATRRSRPPPAPSAQRCAAHVDAAGGVGRGSSGGSRRRPSGSRTGRASVQPRAAQVEDRLARAVAAELGLRAVGVEDPQARDEAGLVGRAEDEHAVGADAGVAVAQRGARAPGSVAAPELGGLDDDVVVAERLPLLEAHRAAQPSAGSPSMLTAFFSATYSSSAPRTALGQLALRPRRRLRALALVGHERHAEAAGVGDPLDVDADHRAVLLGQRGRCRGTRRRPPARTVAAAVQAHDPRRPLEGAQHDDDAPVVAQVRDGLRAAADEVEVGDRVLVEDPQRLDRALGRDVDVAAVAARRGGHEEHALARDPRRQPRVDRIEDLGHHRWRLPAHRRHAEGVSARAPCSPAARRRLEPPTTSVGEHHLGHLLGVATRRIDHLDARAACASR